MKYNFETTLDHRYNGSIRWKQPEGREDILGMGTADMDFHCPPCVEKATRQVSIENTYNYRVRPDSYYNAVTGWFGRQYGMDVKREWVHEIPSTLATIRLMVECYAKPGDYVLMQTPYFAPLKNCIEGAGCHFLTNPMVIKDGRYEMDFEDFEAKIKEYRPSIFLLVSPQNPTGRVFSRDELERMVEICAENNVLIISDEVHFLITFDGIQHTPILQVSEKAREISIMVFSMSKGFNVMSLPHAMFLIPDDKLRKQWADFIIPFDFHYASNSFSIAAITALMSGEADEWLKEVTEFLQKNRDIFIEEVQKRNLPIMPLKPEASYLLWIDCKETGIEPEKLGEAFMEKAGISLNNGLDHGEAGRGYIRLNFAVTRENLYRALDKIENMFK